MKTVKIAAISFSVVVAAAALGACSTRTPPQQSGASQPTPKVVSNVHPYTAGQGTVTAIMPAPTSAAAGGTAPMQRLEIKMDNGTVQYVDTASNEFTKGTRVVLTQDKLIRKM
ncbi:MAG TPA: hypothetical protein VLF65_16490 [Burkholderiales bacterium]|nr:hypothetical protein [Burkholderiales bacterium]